MRNISIEDYVLWDTIKDTLFENPDIVYHYTSVVEMVNNGYVHREGLELRCVAELSLEWQIIISEAIELTK